MTISKEELKTKSDQELLDMVAQSVGHTGKDFPEYMGADFSYSFLTSTLKDRGYENGWHKTSGSDRKAGEPERIVMRKSDDDTVRQSYQLSRSVAKEWKEFNRSIPYKTVTLDAALKRFMSDARSGRIRFELEIPEVFCPEDHLLPETERLSS